MTDTDRMLDYSQSWARSDRLCVFLSRRLRQRAQKTRGLFLPEDQSPLFGFLTASCLQLEVRTEIDQPPTRPQPEPLFIAGTWPAFGLPAAGGGGGVPLPHT